MRWHFCIGPDELIGCEYRCQAAMAQLGQRQNDDLKVLFVLGPRHLFGLVWFVESGPEKCAALAAPTDRTSCRGHDSPGSSPGVDIVVHTRCLFSQTLVGCAQMQRMATKCKCRAFRKVAAHAARTFCMKCLDIRAVSKGRALEMHFNAPQSVCTSACIAFAQSSLLVWPGG